MNTKTKTQNLIQLVALSILAIVFAVGAYHLLSPKVMVAQASPSKEVLQASLPQTAGARVKIYLGAAPIIVTFEDSRWVANRTEVRNWINTTNGTTSVDPSNFVNRIASQVNITATGERDGRSLDTNNLTDQILETLNRGRPNRTITLAVSVIPRGGNRRIDINLSEQTLYAYEGNNLVNQFLVSTGRRGFSTPTGEFNVYSMSRANLMSGPDYYLPNVPWISRFAPGPISVHGTYWHNNFGTPMSHGCINASIPDAEWVYNFVDIGTPVYVHY